RFPFVTANVFKDGSQEHAYRSYTLIPHVVENGDTILIGVTGNTPPGVEVWDRAHVQGVLDFRDVVQSLHPVIRELKARGADVVVVLSHGGLAGTSYDTTSGLPPENASARLAQQVPGIDVIFMGHTHREVADTSINGVLLTQAKNWAQSLATVKLKLERRAPGDWIVIDKRGSVLKPDPARADTAFLDSLRWEHERTVAHVKSVAGRSTARMEAREARVRDTPIIDFINDVQRKASGADLSAAAAFDISAVIPEGPVTIADLAGLYVYDNTLKAIRIDGGQLRQYLEKSAEYYTPGAGIPGYNLDIITGVEYTVDASRSEGQRIVKLTYKGQPVRDDQQFTLALNNYRQSGGGGYAMIAGAPVVYDRQEGVRELLIEEVRRRGVLRPSDFFRRNWELVPAAARDSILAAQRAELRSRSTTTSAGARKLRVLATNDVHGRLLPETYSWSGGRRVGGMAALAAYFKAETAGFDGATIILDGGDVMQGTPISNLTKGRSTVATFNATGYSAAALGNHEFDWGVPVLRDRIAQAKFGWLAANIFNAGTQTRPSWSKPARMVTVDGIKVGIIGLATEETPLVTKASNVAGLEFRSGSAAIDHWVPELRHQGADFVIVVAHSGADCDREFRKCEGEIIDWARETTNKPDLMVAGHTHRMVRYVENGIPIIEAASYTTRYGVADLAKDSAGTRVWIHDFPVPFADRIQPDSTITALVAAAQREIGPQVNRVIATFADTVRRFATGEGPLGNLIADAFRAATGAQLSFINNGGIRSNEIPAGPVTWGTLYALQPFENRMVRLWMTGRQIRAVVERGLSRGVPDMHVSGMSVVYDPSAPAGERVERMTLHSGGPVLDDATYVVGVLDFLAGRGDGYEAFGEAARREDMDLTDLDALIQYLQSLPQPVKVNLAERRYLIKPTN
ncbi:MAG: 5'-nucleotidase C-terminal domain-containing protein, partial [Gemmatimonadota bacterium]